MDTTMLEDAAELRFPSKTNQRMQRLMDRNNDGLLTPDEQDELAALVELSEAISLVRGQALQLLGRCPEGQWLSPK